MKRVVMMSMAGMVGLILISIVVFAQASAEKPARFVFSEEALGKLHKEEIPEEILKKLNDLKGQTYSTETELLDVLEKTLGKDPTAQYKSRIFTLTYQYDATGRREPFESLVGEYPPPPPERTPVPEVGKCPSDAPLRQFELAQLKVVGILLGQAGDRARVLAPDGQSYTIVQNTCIGKFGQIMAFTENCVLVKETKVYEKEKKETETQMCINPVEGEQK